MRLFLRMLVAVLLTLASVPPAFGQGAAGEVSGTVSDPSGGVITSAKVVLRNIETGTENTISTDAGGRYRFLYVRPALYSIVVEASGFQRAEAEPFTINVNEAAVRDFALTVGAMTNTVTVQSDAPLLATRSTELGTVINTRMVNELPLNGRNFTQALTLTPGATPIATAQGAGTGTGSLNDVSIPTSPAFRPSVNGAWNRSNLFYMDGIINTNVLYNGYSILPVVDAIQEFKVQSHNDKAEYGGVLGGIVNIVSKSGSNRFRGSAWEFMRDEAFDARNPYTDATRSKPADFQQHQFGATVGGPVVIPKLFDGENRTFFQFAWESWRYRRVNTNRYYVPTDAELRGDFSRSALNQDIYDPLTTRPDPNNPNAFIRDPFPGRQIPAGRIDPMVVAWLQAYLDRPNYSDPGAPQFNAINTREVTDESDSYQIRGDQRLGSSSSLFWRFSKFNNENFSPDTLKHSVTVTRPRTNMGGGWTATLTPKLLLDTRFGYVQHPFHYDQVFEAVGGGPASDAGFLNVDTLGVPGIGLAGPWSSPGEYRGREIDKLWQYGANLSWLKGAHSLRFGWDLLHQRRTSGPSHGATQNYGFTNALTAHPQQPGSTGASLASALLGLPSQVSYQVQNTSFAWPTWALWVQDEWQVSSKLTLNLGLRYDRLQPPSRAEGEGALFNGFDDRDGAWIIGGDQLPPSCASAGIAPCIPGTGNLNDLVAGNHIRLADYPTLRKPQTMDFGPRVGIAYMLNPRTVLRGGYGISYDLYSGFIQDMVNHFNLWPTAQGAQNSLNSTVGAPLVPLSAVNGFGAAPLPGPNPWSTVSWMSDPEKKNPMAHQWNVEVQRQMTETLALSVAYVGMAGRNLELSGLLNTAQTAGPGTPEEVQARKPFPWAPVIFYGTSRGATNYNSLQFRLDKRFANGLQGLVSYTWSHATDNGSSGFFASENGPGGSASLQNYYDPESGKGVSSYDVPHFLSISGLYDLPFGKGKAHLNSGVAAAVFGNWQIGTIAQVRSGQPYNLVVVGDVANIGNTVSWYNYARPNLVGDPEANVPDGMAFDPAAFAVPVTAYGTFGRNVLRSDFVPSVDLSLTKRFYVDAERYFAFRAEAFNALNVNPKGVPGVTFGAPDFGRISSTAQLPRNLQFGFKFAF